MRFLVGIHTENLDFERLGSIKVLGLKVLSLPDMLYDDIWYTGNSSSFIDDIKDIGGWNYSNNLIFNCSDCSIDLGSSMYEDINKIPMFVSDALLKSNKKSNLSIEISDSYCGNSINILVNLISFECCLYYREVYLYGDYMSESFREYSYYYIGMNRYKLNISIYDLLPLEYNSNCIAIFKNTAIIDLGGDYLNSITVVHNGIETVMLISDEYCYKDITLVFPPTVEKLVYLDSHCMDYLGVSINITYIVPKIPSIPDILVRIFDKTYNNLLNDCDTRDNVISWSSRNLDFWNFYQLAYDDTDRFLSLFNEIANVKVY